MLGSTLRKIGTGAGAALTAGAVALALLHPGVVTREIELHDGGVWVTNQNLRTVGHLNYPARVIDGGLRAGSDSFDVAQSASTVFVSDQDSGSFTQVDVARSVLLAPVQNAAAMQLGGDRVGIADPTTGSVWLMGAQEHSGFSPETTTPALEEEKGAVLAMGLDGSAHVVSAETGRMTTITRAGSMDDKETAPLPDVGAKPDLQVSAVGERTVVLDRSSGTLVRQDGSTVQLPGTDLQLQAPGPDAQEVLVASSDALLRVGDNDEITTVAKRTAGGSPARPARLRSCVYSAWSGKGGYLRDCPNDADDRNEDREDLSSASSAVFRVNRQVIVLNNTEDGGLWLPDEEMIKVDNWDQINSDLKKKEEKEDDTTRTDQEAPTERTEDNTPPEALDDDFGVRPGRSVSLPVIWNDTDPDGDVLVATPTTQPAFGEVVQVRDGEALQGRISPDATGTSSFTYELSDGAGTDTATVTLTVHPWEVNEGPEQLRVGTVVVGQGARVTTNVSGDWVDPDGDPVYLESVAFPSGLDVTWRADGTIAIHDLGQGAGVQDLTVTYSDGRDSTEGTLRVDVRGTDNIAPVANGDHLVVSEGQTAQISPLANDVDANSDTLRVASISEVPAGLSASLDPDLSLVSVTGHTVGTYYLEYTVTDGPSTATGLIRVDVVPADNQSLPVTQDDVATLPAGGEVLVDVLANDSDPSGGVLVVQSVRTKEGSPLVVALLEHHVLRVTAPGGLSETEEIIYTVANAAGTAEGRALVIPAPAVSSTEPPVLADDSLTVRVGDVGSVRVLENDHSPAGLNLSVSDSLQHEIKPEVAAPFVSDGVVRVRAGSKPGSGTIVYTVHDSAGNVASAQVSLNVVALDEEANTAPHPQDVTGWAVAGQSVRIPVPLTGIDSEGDSVTLVGLGSSPKLGTVEVGSDVITYTAAPKTSGTDVFTYTVKDRLGKTARATVRVGVAPPADTNQRPVAVPDQVNVRPGTKVAVPVLGNDVDPDGDALDLVAGLVSAADPALVVEAKGSKVALTTPAEEGTYTVQYGVTDGRSEPVTGLVTVVVSAAAPLLAPIARDDAVPPAEAASQATVSVDVLANDSDPDGDVDLAEVSSTDEGVSVKGGSLAITVGERARYVLYTLVDPDGLSSSAVVHVPGSRLDGPEVDTTKTAGLEVTAGETLTIPINDYVLTRPGRTVQITDPGKVTASLGWDGSNLIGDKTTLTFGASVDYSGPSSVTFEVTDGSDLNDSEGKVATLTLPIKVLPAGNQPPTITPTDIEVAAGEDPVVVDLSKWVRDPDDQDPATMTYSVEPSLSGVSATASGASLSVEAGADTVQGLAGQVTVTVTDQDGATASGTATVRVTASTRERIQVSPISVTTNAGQGVDVDLALSATNPFPDTPLHVVGAPSASDGTSVVVAGTNLTITPPAGTNGTSTVSFRLGDKTNDPSREVEGTIQVTVRDRPAAPTGVSASSPGASTASVSWTAGAANGAPITGFTVYDQTQGDSKSCGQVTTCLFEGRKNGVDHTFHVVATNEVGDSEPSGAATTNIDVVPGTVPAPVGAPGDQQINFSWSAPDNEGSPISGYTVYLSGPDAGNQEQTVTGTSATFKGLRNGGSYTATVIATNAKGNSKISQASKAVTPYGRPGQVSGVSAEAASLGKAQGADRVIVSWTPGDDNGRAVEYYTVSWAGGSVQVDGGGSSSTTLEAVATAEERVSFTVTATNDSAAPETHTSMPTTASAWVVGLPPVPTVSGVRATGNGAEISMAAQVQAGNGWRSTELSPQWSVDGRSWQPVSNLAGNGLAVGSQATVHVRACGSKTGDLVCSEANTENRVVPFTPPTGPTMRCLADGMGVRCTWGGGNGGGRETDYIVTGQIEKHGGASGEEYFAVGEGRYARLCVKAVQHSDELGERSTGESCADATVPTYARNKGAFRGAKAKCVVGECAGREAWLVGVDLSGWPPNSSVTCSGNWAGQHETTTVTVDGNGNYHDAPVWTGYWKGRLMSVNNNDLIDPPWFSCQ